MSADDRRPSQERIDACAFELFFCDVRIDRAGALLSWGNDPHQRAAYKEDAEAALVAAGVGELEAALRDLLTQVGKCGTTRRSSRAPVWCWGEPRRRPAMSTPYFHDPDEHFESLVDYLRHLVDRHGVEETPELWRSGRDEFDRLHARDHVPAARESRARLGGENDAD